MCGIAGIFGPGWRESQLRQMVTSQRHRGPDDEGVFVDPDGLAGLGHNRLSIIDLSPGGRQPMSNSDGSVWVAFNGEIYNYRELRLELHTYPYQSATDTEVILAAYERWGDKCLDHLLGMFAFLLWDSRNQCLLAARDRFGVKPLYYSVQPSGCLWISSEIKALQQVGIGCEPNEPTWATYLARGLYDHSEQTFWENVQSLPAGHALHWSHGNLRITRWYDVAERTGPEWDTRPLKVVQEEYLHLLRDSVRLRFRADVPVGINLSGGLDSSLLLGLVQSVQGPASCVETFTFTTGDPDYDELPWVNQMLQKTHHPSIVSRLEPNLVPSLAESVQQNQDEPFGGLPTLAYARLFELARSRNTIVLLDGQGMDEQWAGYDYYREHSRRASPALVQGANDRVVRPECLAPEFRAKAQTFQPLKPFPDTLRNLQYRDLRYTKIPRALRFNDRVSMRCSTELREPFLDHRLVELAFQQPVKRKITEGIGKWLPRQIARQLLPDMVSQAPKRPVQTPQREWLRGPLRLWARDSIEDALSCWGGAWLSARAVRDTWDDYCLGRSDNSFYIWQWINLGLISRVAAGAVHE